MRLLALSLLLLAVVSVVASATKHNGHSLLSSLSSHASSSCTYHAVDVQSAPNNISLSVFAAAGLLNRGGANIYVLRGARDPFWKAQIIDPHCNATSHADPYRFLANLYSSGQVKNIIKYSDPVPRTLPSVITMAGVLDAVPMQESLHQYMMIAFGNEMKGSAVVLDARGGVWENQYQAFNYTIDNALPRTRGYSWQSTGYAEAGVLVDFQIANAQFVHNLPNACEGGTEGNKLLQRMAARAPLNVSGWTPPIVVSGYNSEDVFFGGDLFEAETDCHKIGASLGLGQMASAGTHNLAFFTHFRPFNRSAPRGSEFGPLQQAQETAGLVFNGSKKYVALV